MQCDKCKRDFEEKEIHEHHIHPRFMDNPRGDGKKIYLCERCHNILHNMIPSILYKFILDKQRSIWEVINFTERWINDNYQERS
jgi:hypothetical protein